MPIKMDRFTWAVVVFVVLLLVGAVVTLSLANDTATTSAVDYLDEDSPSAAVYNAYVAFLNSDASTGRQYYSADVLEEADQDSTFKDRMYYNQPQNQRLRILSVEERGEDSALVTIAIDHYSGGGLFNSGSTWTDQQTVPVVREEDGWKIDLLMWF